MKNNLISLFLLTLLFLIFKNNTLVINTTLQGINLFINKLFPYLFIMIIINDLLLSCNITNKFKNKYNYIFFISLLSGTPTSTTIIKELYQNKIISKDFANYSLLTTFFYNPLFLYTILNSLFPKLIVVKLLLIHYLTKGIQSIIYHKHLINYTLDTSNKEFNIAKSINKSININLNILGTIIFYLVITNILQLNPFLTGLIEVTSGLNTLYYHGIIKELYALVIISFGGLSIHTQVYSILNNTNLSYKYFLKGRLLEIFISLLLFILINIC